MATYSKFLQLASGTATTASLGFGSGNTLQLADLQLAGSTSGTLDMLAAATTTTYTLTWPAAVAGGNGYVLSSTTGGVLSWVTAPTTGITQLTGDVTAGPGTGSVAATLAATSNSTLTTLSGLTTASSLASVGTITSGTWNGTTIAIAHGGTGVTSATTTPTPSAFAAWDANKNLSANSMISGYTTTATAGTTTTLTVSSTQQQYFTGTTTQTVVLPVTSTLVLGQSFTIVNNSTGIVTVESSGANTIQAMGANSQLIVTVISTSLTTAAAWNAEYSTATGGTVTSVALTVPAFLSVSGSPVTTSGTLAVSYSGTALPIANGGTNATTAVTAYNNLSPMTTTGDLEYEVSAGTAARLPIGSTGQVLTVVSGAPAWAAASSTAGVVSTSETAGQSFSATTLYAVRYEITADSGTAGRVYGADNSATTTSYVIGLAYPPGSVSAAGAITVTEQGIINVPSHGFTPGTPIYLSTSGAVTATAPSTTGTTVVRVGMVKDANNIWVQVHTIGTN